MQKVTTDELPDIDQDEAVPTSAAEFLALNEKIENEKKASIKTLEEALHIHLSGMNRHERRSYLAKHSRKAGKRREKALTQRNGTETI